MTVDRHQLHDLIDVLPDDQAELVMVDVRRRLRKTETEGTWPSEFFGIIDGSEVPLNLARNHDDFLADAGFGRDSCGRSHGATSSRSTWRTMIMLGSLS